MMARTVAVPDNFDDIVDRLFCEEILRDLLRRRKYYFLRELEVDELFLIDSIGIALRTPLSFSGPFIETGNDAYT